MKAAFYIAIALAAGLFFARAENFEVRRLGAEVNSRQDEFLPCLYKGYLYFGRAKTSSAAIAKNYKIYRAKFEAGKLGKVEKANVNPLNFRGKIKRATASIKSGNCPRTRFLMMKTAVPRSDGKGTRFFYDFHPTASRDGRIAVFATDYYGGEKDSATDLVVSFKIAGGDWRSPIKLGPEINSRDYEISPFIASDGALIFASRRNGRDFDLYYAPPDGFGRWKTPVRLPFPINGASDETGPFAAGDYFFFASNRGNGDFNIYYCEYSKILNFVRNRTEKEAKNITKAKIDDSRWNKSLMDEFREVNKAK